MAWRDSSLGEVLTLQRGFDLPSRERREGTVPVVSSSGITGYHDVARIPGPGVVTGRYGTLGEVHFIREGFWPLNTSLFVVDFKGNDPRFCAYLLESLEFASQNAAGAVPGVNRNHLHSMSVRLPDVATQRRVAAVLAAYEDLMENSESRLRTLERMAGSLFLSWFPESKLRPTSSVGHETVPLSELCSFQRGRSYRSTELVEAGGTPFVNLKCVDRDGGFRRSGLKRFSADVKPAHLAAPGDIFVAVTDMTQDRRIVARAARAPSDLPGGSVFSMDLVKVVPKYEHDADFLYGLLRYSGFAAEVKLFANGANVLHLSPERILDYRIAVPSAEERRRFSNNVSTWWSLADALTARSEVLRATRDLLLPRLLSGELDVSRVPDPAELTPESAP